jgi:hypothetical protein
MTTMNDALPEELLFQPDGHLTEVALAFAADGELDLLQPLHVRAHHHLDDCEHCAHLLGEAALLSVLAGDVLRERPLVQVAVSLVSVPSPLPGVAVASGVRKRRPFPLAAIAAALVLAALTAGPSMLDAIQGVPGMIAAAPFLLRVAAAFVRAPWGAGTTALLVKCGSALLLAAVGLQVARMTSRSGSWQQGGV